MARLIHYDVYVWQTNRWELIAHYSQEQRLDALDYAKDIERAELHATKVVQEVYDQTDQTINETLIYVSKLPTTNHPGSSHRARGGDIPSGKKKKEKKKNYTVADNLILFLLTTFFSLLLAGVITAGILHFMLLSDKMAPIADSQEFVLGVFTIFFLLFFVPLALKWVRNISFSRDIYASGDDDEDTNDNAGNAGKKDQSDFKYSKKELYEMNNPEEAENEANARRKKRSVSFLSRLLWGGFAVFDIITGKHTFADKMKETEKSEEAEEKQQDAPVGEEQKTEDKKEEEQKEEEETIDETSPETEMAEEELEQKIKEEKPVEKEDNKEEKQEKVEIPQEIEKYYLMMTSFLSVLLRVLQNRNILLNAYNRFGLELFLAGACECLCHEFKLESRQNRVILSGLLTLLGRSAGLADIFYFKLDEYSLEPQYLRMIKAGTETMRIFNENKTSPELVTRFQQAMEDWAHPEQKEAAASGTCTVMFTDMVSSTSITDELGDHMAQQLVRLHNSIVRKILQLCGGKEIKHTGDGIMASFLWASNAVEAAINIQKAVRESNFQSPTVPLEVRIGLNSGEPIVEDNDLFGHTVQMASRVCGQAGANQIYVSAVVKDLAAGKNFVFKLLGEFNLKGITEPQQLYEVVWNDPSEFSDDDSPNRKEPEKEETNLSENLPEF